MWLDGIRYFPPAYISATYLKHASNFIYRRFTDEATSSTMKPALRAEKINHATFLSQLRFYEDLVPKSLEGLEEVRLREIPETLAQRRKDGNAFLEKTEVTALVEWKLYVS